MSTPNQQSVSQQNVNQAMKAQPLLPTLSSMQWKGLYEVREAEEQSREAVIADGVRDSLVALQLILPDMDRYHRITEKAKSLFQQAAPDNH